MNRQAFLDVLQKLSTSWARSVIADDRFTYVHLTEQFLEAQNGLTAMRLPMPKSEMAGLDVAVPADMFLRLVKTLTGKNIRLRRMKEQLEFVSGTARGQLVALGGDWPKLQFPKGTDGYKKVPPLLGPAMQLCLRSVEPDYTAIQGMLISGSMAVATDGARISLARLGGKIGVRVVFPRELVQVLSIFEEHELARFRIDMEEDGGDVYFRTKDGGYVHGKVLKPQPLWEEVVDWCKKARAQVGTSVSLPKRLKAALERQLVVQAEIPEMDRDTRIAFKKDHILLTSAVEAAGLVTDTFKIGPHRALDGIAFLINPGFLLDALSRGDRFEYVTKGGIVRICGKHFEHLMRSAPAKR